MTFSNFVAASIKKSLKLALSVALLGTVIACEEEGEPIQSSGEAARDRYGVLNATFFVDKIGASTTETLGYNSWGFPNKKKFNFRACFKDQLLRGALQNWDVIILDGTSQKLVQTDFGGCANWSEVYTFDYFAPESYIEVTRIFNVTGGHKGDVKVVLGVNPWSGSVVDLRYDEIVDITPNAAGPSTFTAVMSTTDTEKAVTDQKKISLTYQGHAYNDFEMDHNLSLKVAHYYQVEFSPKVYRRTLSKAKSGESPEQGLVRIKAILLRDDLDNPDLSSLDNFITAFEKTFSVDNGSVKTQIVLKFPDITAIASRMKALVRVEPIVDSPSVVGANFEGYLGALPGGSFDLVPSQYDVDQIYNKFTAFERQKDQEGLSGIGLLHAAGGVIPLTTQDLEDAMSPMYCWDGELENCKYVSFAKAVCDSLGLKDEGLCTINPAINISYLGQVDEGWIVENKAPVSIKRRGITTLPETFEMGIGIANQQSFNWSSNWSFTLNPLTLVSIIFLPAGKAIESVVKPVLDLVGRFAGGGSGFSYGRVTARSSGVKAGQSLSLTSRGQSFDIETLARKCMIYSVTAPDLAAKWGVNLKSAYYCDEEPSKVTATETFYYITGGGMASDAWTDGESHVENPFLMLVRGNSTKDTFRDIVRDKTIKLELNHLEIPRDSTEIPQAIYERINQKFPGMISGEVTVLE
jgi:hypothetical protein